MNFKIFLTEQADSDLRGIYEYIAFTLLEPDISARQLERIKNANAAWMKCQVDLGYLNRNM